LASWHTFNYLHRLFYSLHQRKAMREGELRLSRGNKNFFRSQNKIFEKNLESCIALCVARKPWPGLFPILIFRSSNFYFYFFVMIWEKRARYNRAWKSVFPGNCSFVRCRNLDNWLKTVEKIGWMLYKNASHGLECIMETNDTKCCSIQWSSSCITKD